MLWWSFNELAHRDLDDGSLADAHALRRLGQQPTCFLGQAEARGSSGFHGFQLYPTA
jgi:hypothetical protein